MSNLYLLHYAVRGIKSLDEWAELSFYKKTIPPEFSVRGYNVKGIYGANGAGKSAIVTSAKILKSLLQDGAYLNNPIVQNQMKELVNKRTGCLEMTAEFLMTPKSRRRIYRYCVGIERNEAGKYELVTESLSSRSASSHGTTFSESYHVERGNLKIQGGADDFAERLIEQTKNLLVSASVPALYIEKMFLRDPLENMGALVSDILSLFIFGSRLCVFMENDDEHADYVMDEMAERIGQAGEAFQELLSHRRALDNFRPYTLSARTMSIGKQFYPQMKEQVKRLTDFLKIFKQELLEIRIDRREDRHLYQCSLILVYEDCSVRAEFESNGIKKLIRLFDFVEKMVSGSIVFIDELDSNLHDVYLCALLEYLMEYGEGQLCFTSHNIGPMDVLRRGKKSIDFLSVDHRLYAWTANGNYSPAKLYKHGMIEGSPFNVDSIDFIGVFDPEGDT